MKPNIEWKSIKSLQQIGYGAFGEVLMGYSSLYGNVALKRLVFDSDYEDEEFLRQFFNEASIISIMCSPYIIRYYGTTISDDCEQYIVTEFASGGSLSQFISKRATHYNSEFPWSSRYKISLETAKGMGFIHSRGIVHRDIKSDNILLDENLTVKICDFGLSKLKDSTLSKSGSFEGTLIYRAPETFGSHCTFESDIYSMGMVFWEIATGRVPFENTKATSLAKAIKQGETIPLDLPPEYSRIITDCWNKNPSQRPKIYQIIEQLELLVQKYPLEKDNSGSINDKKQRLLYEAQLAAMQEEKNMLEEKLKKVETINHSMASIICKEGLINDVFLAAEKGSLNSVIYFLAKGIDVNVVDVYDFLNFKMKPLFIKQPNLIRKRLQKFYY